MSMIRIAVCACVVVGLAGSGFGQDGRWLELPALPEAVSNNAVTSVDHGDGTWTLYSFMGIHPPALGLAQATLESRKLDWPGGVWAPIADAPEDSRGRAKIAASAVTVAGEVYLIGGYSPARNEITEKRLFRYNPDTDDYTELAPVPMEVDDTVPAVYQDRYIYLISGWHGPINDNITNVQIYDTHLDSWQQCTPIPGPFDGLFGHTGGISGDTLFYGDGAVSNGGFLISNKFYTGAIDPNDPTQIAWTERPAHPGEPTYRAAASQGTLPKGSVLIVGGTNNPYNTSGGGYDGNPSLPLHQVLAYTPETDHWTLLHIAGDKPDTMDHRNLVRLGDGWAIIGGMTSPQHSTATCWMLEIEPCRADLDGDGDTDGDDFQLWLDAFNAREPAADQNSDGDITPADYSAFLAGARRGCL